MGPHGISPFNSPTKNGLFSLLLFFILSVSLCGNLIWNFLNNVIQPNMFIPMITMNKPAIIFNIPCRSSGIPIPPPPVNNIPIPPSKKPITEYEITLFFPKSPLISFAERQKFPFKIKEGSSIHCNLRRNPKPDLLQTPHQNQIFQKSL